ncbi:MAG: IS4 family transposase [Schleiferiaceae bacterium]|nr:IS4 family transposase [Schleiferiaceae bacterium]
MIDSYFTGFYDNVFPDKRIDKRVEKISQELVHFGSAIVNVASSSHTSKTGFYRFLMNKRADYTNILAGSFRKCRENIDQEHVLCIQDTTEFNYASTAAKLENDPDIGPTTKKEVAGLFCHPTIVCDTEGKTIYGLASASIYNRGWRQKDKYQRAYKTLPIDQKESFRWLESARLSRKRLPENVALTIIGDRESDIYDEFAEVTSYPKTEVLVRSRTDRNIVGGSGKLYNELENQPVSETYSLQLPSNKSRDKRLAKMEVRFCKVKVKAPLRYTGSQKSISLYAVEAREVTPEVPAGQDRVLWRLLTTHAVEDANKALQCIQWYKNRWLIEELFRVIKSKGFRIESSQLGSGAAIKKLTALVLEAALHTMRLKLALQKKDQDKASLIFNQKQLALLSILLKKVEGKTAKQKNPYIKDTLAWAAWIIARLGKWTGYKSHGPPGYITMKNGYDKFNSQFEVFELLSKDVYKD